MSNEIENMSEDLQIIKKIIKELLVELNKLKKETEYNVSSMNGITDKIEDKINSSLASFKNNNDKLESIFKEHITANQNLEKNISILTMLPKKIETRIDGTVPRIAEELANQSVKNVERTKGQFDLLNQEMALRVHEQQERISKTTDKLIRDTSIVSKSNIRGFLVSMVVTVVIAIGSSAATSYLVTTKYPRFVNITGAHEISIESSKVEIWEQIESTKKEKTNDRYKIK